MRWPGRRQPKVFISYRREDSAFETTAIYENLAREFGSKNVFMDVDSIPAGQDFRKLIQRSVHDCDVLLAVVGNRWLSAMDASGTRRLESATDFVRIEIEAALERNIPVIPVFVGHAAMPQAAQMPASLQEFVFRNALSVRPGKDFRHDISEIIRQISLTLAYRDHGAEAARSRERVGTISESPRAATLRSSIGSTSANASLVSESQLQPNWRRWAFCVGNGFAAGSIFCLLWIVITLIEKLNYHDTVSWAFGVIATVMIGIFSGACAVIARARELAGRRLAEMVFGARKTRRSAVLRSFASGLTDALTLAIVMGTLTHRTAYGDSRIRLFATLFTMFCPQFTAIQILMGKRYGRREPSGWRLIASELFWFAVGAVLGSLGWCASYIAAPGDLDRWDLEEMAVYSTASGSIYAAIVAGNRAIFREVNAAPTATNA
jgi:hypothetical protein